MIKVATLATAVGVATTGVNTGKPYFSVTKTTFSDTPETVRFMQFDKGLQVDTAWTDFFGTEDIAVANVIEDPNAH